MCVCVYVGACTCLYAGVCHMCARACVYADVYARAYMYTYVHRCAHVCVYVSPCMYMCICGVGMYVHVSVPDPSKQRGLESEQGACRLRGLS